MSEYSSNMSTKNDAIFSGYKMALYTFWTQRPITSIEHLSKIIADNTEEDICPLYRLWIEILADQKDEQALSSLNRHLLYRLSTEDESFLSEDQEHSISALRGLIHCELDELQAARLIYTSLKDDRSNQYVEELYFTIQNRLKLSADTDGLWAIKDKINDYYVLSTLVKGLIINQESQKLHNILSKINTMFENSPIYRQYKLHSYFDYNDFNSMYKISNELMEMYPTNLDYVVYTAYSLCKLNDYYEAAKILRHTYFTTKEDDLDILYLLLLSEVEVLKEEYKDNNLSYVNQMFDTESDYNILLLLSKVETLLESNGFLSIDIDSIKNEINDIYWKLNIKDQPSSENKTETQVPKCWLTLVDESNYNFIRNSQVNKIKNIKKELPERTKPGDICFVVHTDYRNQVKKELESGSYLRIGAVYEVISTPDSMHNNTCKLKLIARPLNSIPIDYEFKDNLTVGQSFELDLSALDIIIDSISNYNEDRSFASSFGNIVDGMLTKKIS